jgi:plastocyanin
VWRRQDEGVTTAEQYPRRVLHPYARRAAVGVLLAGAVLSGCGRGSLTSDTATGTVTPGPVTAPAAAPATISISGFSFGAPVTVSPGQVVTVVNTDPADHTVTADDKRSFDAKVGADAQSAFTAPAAPGSYAFTCTVHPTMHGVLIVH